MPWQERHIRYDVTRLHICISKERILTLCLCLRKYKSTERCICGTGCILFSILLAYTYIILVQRLGRQVVFGVWAKFCANICATNASLCTQSASPSFKCTNKDHQLRRYTVTIKSYHPCWSRPHRPRSLVCWCRVRQRAHALQAAYTPAPDRIALKQIPRKEGASKIWSQRVGETSLLAYLICWQ